MKRSLLIVMLLIGTGVVAQGKYVINLAVTKLKAGDDSVVFPKGGKKFNIATNGKTDTLEIGKCGMETVGMTIEVRKVKAGEQIRTQIGYAFYKRSGNKWELIYHFGYTDRYDLLKYPANKKLPPPKEEYHCEYGVPAQFSADFRMDVYQ